MKKSTLFWLGIMTLLVSAEARATVPFEAGACTEQVKDRTIDSNKLVGLSFAETVVCVKDGRVVEIAYRKHWDKPSEPWQRLSDDEARSQGYALGRTSLFNINHGGSEAYHWNTLIPFCVTHVESVFRTFNRIADQARVASRERNAASMFSDQALANQEKAGAAALKAANAPPF